MSSEFAKAILKHIQPALVVRRVQEVLEHEWAKGCIPSIAPVPVEIEPPYTSLAFAAGMPGGPSPGCWVEAQAEDPRDWQRVQVWMSPEQTGNWMHRSERFLKQLSRAKYRVAMELLGNSDRVDQLLLFHKEDEPLIRAAFAGEFERCMLTPARWIPHAMPDNLRPAILRFRDFLPAPPYTRLLTRPDELRESVYGSIVSALAGLRREAFGLLQVVFQPARPDHNWHDNIRRLIDLEYELKQVITWQAAYANAHHLPSGYISTMADDLNTKAHNDKPFLFSAIRLALGGVAEDADANIAALSAFAGLIQYGGRPLGSLTERHYYQLLPPEQIARLLAMAQTYRAGFPLNSNELTALIQFCRPAATEFRPQHLQALETLVPSDDLADGLQIGVCIHADSELRVCIPLESRRKHTHVIGRPGTGKSSLMENMVLEETALGHGVAVLDPHGPLVERLLKLIPAEHADRVIYIDPADAHYVPSWNPLHSGADHNPERVAIDLVSAVRSIVDGWGDRLAHLLHHAFFALLHLPDACLRDMADLLRKGTPASQEIIRSITASTMTNDLARRFWTEDFPGYARDTLHPPQHKLSKLLLGGTVSLMLSQPESKLNLRNVMDEGKILLVDLSGLGADTRDTLGCFLLSLLHLTALGRLRGTDASLRPFHIYCDEAHRFVTTALDDLIAEARKYGVSLTLAHQFMAQFATRKIGALSSVASTIIFGVDEKDAEYLKKDLLGRVEVKDLIAQGVGQAIARISTHDQTEIVRVRTLGPREVLPTNCRDAIIAQSRRLYYDPIDEVRQRVAERARRRAEPDQTASISRDVVEPEYDEL